MFDRFYRGERSRSRSTGGLGIGHAIVKQIVLAHKGQVSAVSDPGTFQLTVILPG
ncbi:ATP-binding protein [Alicyclobacillus acidoterrestris]|uniref:ATP-binding protein n=1 Tax=Alicyclobacillus acidoterrestris TaxID=1450 RepID=UPI0009DB940F